ncbi:MFS transporter [Oribacterium sp. C9]|uniref:MFS transporter n=1 Tax=Oribacterium sp. C9 TaxID=1943579 RepID=UPI00143B3E41|nr:MFS transporter [Oribacterium sp. C9]
MEAAIRKEAQRDLRTGDTKSMLQDKYKKYMKEDGIHFVPVWRIVGFSGANMAVNLYMGLTMIMSFYLNGYVGMAVILASSFSTITRLWDGVTDPIVGYFVDRFKETEKLGKTRLCLIMGGLLLFINSFLMFNVTDRLPEGALRPAFFILFTAIYYIGYTFLNISNHVGNVCLTNDPAQRPILSIVGTVLVRIMRAMMQMVIAGLAVKYGSMKSAELFHEYWLYVSVIATIGIVIAYVSIIPKDVPFFSETSQKEKKNIRFSDYLGVLKNNRPLQMLIVARATDQFSNTCKTSAITLVLYGIVVGNYELSGGWTLYTTIVGLVMMTLGIGAIGSRLGLKKAMQVGSWGVIVFDTIAVLIWTLMDPKTLSLPGFVNGYGEAFNGFTAFTVALFLVTVIGGGFQMITSSIIPPMIADVNDYEASRTGKYIPGMVGTVFSFMDKLISSFGPTFVGIGFALIGFKEAFPDLNTAYSHSLLIIAIVFYYGLELLGAVFNVIAMKFYELSPEKMKAVEAKIYEMRKDNA